MQNDINVCSFSPVGTYPRSEASVDPYELLGRLYTPDQLPREEEENSQEGGNNNLKFLRKAKLTAASSMQHTNMCEEQERVIRNSA